jgi:thiosulfate/3-mercaptopyruvate sulfurtransferase
MVVVYDDGKLIDASRVFWALEVYGLKQVRVLERGFSGWLRQDYPVSAETPAVTPSQFVPTVDHRRIASKFATRLASLNPRQVVVDARPGKAYRGETSTAKRYGHIPTAISIPVHDNVREENGELLLRDTKELQQLYADLPRDGKVILYCEIGRVSSTNYLALRELGYDVANYDASWKEWGNDFSLPIEK